jgi:hypothetical protein
MGWDFKKISPSKNPELYKQLGAGLRVQLHLLREVDTSLDRSLKDKKRTWPIRNFLSNCLSDRIIHMEMQSRIHAADKIGNAHYGGMLRRKNNYKDSKLPDRFRFNLGHIIMQRVQCMKRTVN